MKILNIKNIKKEKGFTLIEVLCSMAIFAILFSLALQIQLDSRNIKRYNHKLKSYTYEFSYIKNSIIYNLSYNDVIKLWDENKRYVNLTDDFIDKSVPKSAKELFLDRNSTKNYIEIEVEKGEILKIYLKMNVNVYGIMKSKECEFYKGNFQR
jgi:prepilin-type N-terminal cleavage/methylation domain-containing protein